MADSIPRKSFAGTCLVILVALALSTHSALAETIVLKSGNGTLKQEDSLITFYSGSPGVPLPALGTAEFDAAEAGSLAWICGQAAGSWVASLPCEPQAQWIGINSSGSPATALYAMKFTIQSSPIKSATLDFCWAADDRLGDVASHPEGVFINRSPIPQITGGDYLAESLAGPIDITSLVQPGSNTIFIYNQDCAFVVSGVMFQAAITVEPACQAAAEAGFDSTICRGDSTTLSGSQSLVVNCGSALEYLWSWPGNPGSWSANPDITVSPTVTTTYMLEVRCASEPDCTSLDEVTVVVKICPMAVRYDFYGAEKTPEGVLIRWGTHSEEETLGFLVYRFSDPDKPGKPVSERPVPAQGPGRAYQVLDASAEQSPELPSYLGIFYRIVEITASGEGDATPLFPVQTVRQPRDIRRPRTAGSLGGDGRAHPESPRSP